MRGRGGGGGGRTPNKNNRLVVKISDLIPLRLSLIFWHNLNWESIAYYLKIGYSREYPNTPFWSLLLVIFKISDDKPRHFLHESTPGFTRLRDGSLNGILISVLQNRIRDIPV